MVQEMGFIDQIKKRDYEANEEGNEGKTGGAN